MLHELVIADLALIERATLSFGTGVNVLTGETGAGKSLLIGALELLLGERPRPGLVRQGASRATVEGRFTLAASAQGEKRRGRALAKPAAGAEPRLERWIAQHLPQVAEEWAELAAGDERELILGRSLGSDGRSRAYVNQRPVPLRTLRELARRLFEIHGQNDHQRLLEPAEQLRLLDSFGGLEGAVLAYRAKRARWLELAERTLRLEAEQRERRDRLDLVRFQLAEILSVSPDPVERSELGPEREVLRHAENLKGGLGNLVGELCEDEGNLLDRLRRGERMLELWRGQVSSLAPAADELTAARVHLEEAAGALRSFVERLEIDPARLEQIEARLAELERLERKHACTAAGLLERARELESEVAALEADESTLDALSGEIAKAREELLRSGGDLRRARKGLRAGLQRGVQEALAELGLEKAQFDLRLGQRSDDEGEELPAGEGRAVLEADLRRFGERGMDRLEFLLCANPGGALQRLRQVASGGETARIMLALRSVLAAGDPGRTLVFDEIDSGVGGRLAPAVAAHMRKLAAHHQVLCVTHLPGIAAAAQRHLRVRKLVESGRTRLVVEELHGDARVQEVADMIAGGADQETARAEARRLIG